MLLDCLRRTHSSSREALRFRGRARRCPHWYRQEPTSDHLACGGNAMWFCHAMLSEPVAVSVDSKRSPVSGPEGRDRARDAL